MSPIIYTTRLPLSIAQRQPSKGSIFSSASFGQSPEETLWIFKIDYDRRSARVTNGEHLLRQLAVRGAERTGGIKALVKYRFITGPSLVEVREPAKLSEHSASAVLHAPRGGQFGAGLLFSEGLLSDGPDTIIYQSLGARGAQGSPSELIAAQAGKVEALWPRQEGNEQSERVQRVFIFPGLD